VAGRESERILVELQRPLKVVNTDHGVNDFGQFFFQNRQMPTWTDPRRLLPFAQKKLKRFDTSLRIRLAWMSLDSPEGRSTRRDTFEFSQAFQRHHAGTM
jgi:hypothetical protein